MSKIEHSVATVFPSLPSTASYKVTNDRAIEIGKVFLRMKRVVVRV